MISQNERYIALQTPLGKDVLLLSNFSGSEGLSQLFSFDLDLLSENHNIDFKEIIGKGVVVKLVTSGGSMRNFHGLISRFSHSGGGGELTENDQFSNYSATMVPWFWLLKHTSDCRIFQEKSVPDIVEAIFNEKGLNDYKLKLSKTYSKRTYCVQYRETDFNFISRLLEEEGIYYFFEHEEKKHTLVIADSPGEHAPCPFQDKVNFQIATGGGWFDEDVVTGIEIEQEIRPNKYSLNDYNFEMPTSDFVVSTTTNQDLAPGELEIYDHPGEYQKMADGKRLVDIRMEEEEVQITTVSGVGNCRTFTSGYTFTLGRHFRADLSDKTFILTFVQHSASQNPYRSGEDVQASYSNSFQCIPEEVPFRPPRRTPRPVIDGVQTAIVVGPAGEEIYTDEHGRVKVLFHWDREGKGDESSSCWIRVSQTWAGAKWGGLHIPRIGQEVIVDFLEGDPDRPIIVGRVYHGNNKPPYDLPSEKTRSTLKSDSTPGGGGSNEIRFEDKKGSEEVYLHGEKDWTILIENDKNQTVGHDETLSVGNNRDKTVGVDQSETIGSNKSITVGVNHTESIGANMILNVGANKAETVAVNSAETVGAAKALTIGAAYQITVGAAMSQVIGAGSSISVASDSSENIGSDKSVSVGKDINFDSGEKMSFSAGDDYLVSSDKKGVIEVADQLTLKCGKASITLKKNGDISIQGKQINIKGSGNVVIKGKKILEN